MPEGRGGEAKGATETVHNCVNLLWLPFFLFFFFFSGGSFLCQEDALGCRAGDTTIFISHSQGRLHDEEHVIKQTKTYISNKTINNKKLKKNDKKQMKKQTTQQFSFCAAMANLVCKY